MRALVSRLIQSRPSWSGLRVIAVFRNCRQLSTDSNRVDEPFKVEEAETVGASTLPSEKLLVLGGNGFVGSHVCKEALKKGIPVSSLNRSGKPSVQESWANDVVWCQGDLLLPELWKDILHDITAVISCVGGFGSNSQMYKINGTANINAIKAAAEKGVKRFVYVSAADFGPVSYLLKGYYEGKKAAESELFSKFPYGGAICSLWRACEDMEYLFPCMRALPVWFMAQIGWVDLLSMQFFQMTFWEGDPTDRSHTQTRIYPWNSPSWKHENSTGNSWITSRNGISTHPSFQDQVLQHAKPLTRLPLVGPLFVPPVSVKIVAKVAVRAATDQVFPPGIVDVYGIQRHEGQL